METKSALWQNLIESRSREMQFLDTPCERTPESTFSTLAFSDSRDISTTRPSATGCGFPPGAPLNMTDRNGLQAHEPTSEILSGAKDPLAHTVLIVDHVIAQRANALDLHRYNVILFQRSDARRRAGADKVEGKERHDP